MANLFGRIGWTIVVLGIALAAFPRPVVGHCGPGDRPTSAGHHAGHGAGHHDASDQDTKAPADCPHCPPADCRRHLDCASGTDSAVGASTPRPVRAAPAVTATSIDRPVLTRGLEPPTPPPQPRA